MSDNPTTPLPGHSSDCDPSRRFILDMNWTQADRQRAVSVLAHLEVCADCRASLTEFDQLRTILTSEIAAGDETEESPQNDWVGAALQQASQQAGPASSQQKPAVTLPARSLRIPFLRYAAAACLAFAIASGGYWIGQRAKENASEFSIAPTPSSSRIAPAELANRVAAFEQVSDTLDRRAEWLLVSDNTSDVGVGPAPAVDRHVLVVRLTVTGHKDRFSQGSGGVGDVISSADLAILPGRTAKLSLPFSDGRTLSYQISAGVGDPMRLALFAELLTQKGPADSHMAGSSSEPLAAIATTLDLRSDSAATAGSFETSAGRYNLTVGFSRAELTQATPQGTQ